MCSGFTIRCNGRTRRSRRCHEAAKRRSPCWSQGTELTGLPENSPPKRFLGVRRVGISRNIKKRQMNVILRESTGFFNRPLRSLFERLPSAENNYCTYLPRRGKGKPLMVLCRLGATNGGDVECTHRGIDQLRRLADDRDVQGLVVVLLLPPWKLHVAACYQAGM